MSTVSLRIDQDLVLQAEREAKIQNRSKAKQLEYWAKLGKVISSTLDIADVYAVSQGIKSIKLDVASSAQSTPLDPDTIFDNLENDRTKGSLAAKVTAARIYYEASTSQPGYLDRVDSTTGERQAGFFKNGKFKAL